MAEKWGRTRKMLLGIASAPSLLSITALNVYWSRRSALISSDRCRMSCEAFVCQPMSKGQAAYHPGKPGRFELDVDLMGERTSIIG